MSRKPRGDWSRCGLTLVQKPLDERPSDKPSCPKCCGRRLTHHGTGTTLLGGGDGTLDGDPNHRWESWECKACQFHFTRETHDGAVWYSENGRKGMVYSGLPTCFEFYALTHEDCGGDVTRQHVGLDGESKLSCLSNSIQPDGTYKPDYRTFFQCSKCHQRAEMT